VPGRPVSPTDPDVFQNIVGNDYLNVMKVPILFGRGFTDRDNAAGPKVALINETMARVYFPGTSPLGRTYSLGQDPEWQNIQIIGVVKNGKYMRLQEKPTPAAFYPRAQHYGYQSKFVVRYRGEGRELGPRIRRAIAEVDRNLPVSDMRSLADIVDGSVEGKRLVAQLSAVFGALAALLACIGMYGVMSYGVARRTNELGIRMALGASRIDVLWMVLREIVTLLLIGTAVGVALAIASARLLRNLEADLKTFDPLALGVATLALLLVALLAGYLPARRATRIDPMIALRYE